MFVCSPYKILRHVSPSTTGSSASATFPLPAASVWLRLWPFCTVNLKFQDRFEPKLVFIARVKNFSPSFLGFIVPARPFDFDRFSNSIGFSCNKDRSSKETFSNFSRERLHPRIRWTNNRIRFLRNYKSRSVKIPLENPLTTTVIARSFFVIFTI